MTFDLKAQPASISSAICGLRRIIIVFSFFQTNKMENGKGNGLTFLPRTKRSRFRSKYIYLRTDYNCNRFTVEINLAFQSIA